MAQDDFAIVVGISRYTRPRMLPLQGPENDVKDFYTWLVDSTKGDVPAAHIIKVLSSDRAYKGDQPTMEQIVDKFAELYEKAQAFANDPENLKKPRRLYIFLAGHGLSWDVNSAALLTANANYDMLWRGRHVSGRWFAEWFRDNATFEEIVLLMDCCRDTYADTEEHKPWPRDPSPAAADVKIFYGLATKGGAQSREQILPEGGKNWRGLFTYALLDGLENAERDAQGRLLGEALRVYIVKRLKEISAPGIEQDPRIEVQPPDGIEWVRRAEPTLNEVRITVLPPQNALIEVEDPDLDKILATFPADQPFDLPNLEGGIYNLRWPDQSEIGFEIVGSNQKIRVTVLPDAAPGKQVHYDR